MQIIKHRVNSSKDLREIDNSFGIELDIRSIGNDLIVSHDAFNSDAEVFSEWLLSYQHGTLVVNIKEEGIEEAIIETLVNANVSNYFLLDQSFPFLVKGLRAGHSRTAARISDFESISTLRNLSKGFPITPGWAWLDSFTGRWDHLGGLDELQSMGYKTCLVSPELQGRFADDEILAISSFCDIDSIDAVCTKTPNFWISKNAC
jgi:hypothetical protein